MVQESQTPSHADVAGTAPPVDVKTAAHFLGVSPSLVYAYVERKQIPHYRIGRCIRFQVHDLAVWRRQFRIDGGIDEQKRKTPELERGHL
jgi:excisionase family DNA binding protein